MSIEPSQAKKGKRGGIEKMRLRPPETEATSEEKKGKGFREEKGAGGELTGNLQS